MMSESDPFLVAVAGLATRFEPILDKMLQLGDLQLQVAEVQVKRELRIAERELAAETLSDGKEAGPSRLEELQQELECLRVEAEMLRLRLEMEEAAAAFSKEKKRSA